VGALAAACAPGNRAAPIVAPAVQTPAPTAAATAVAPAAGATQDPQATADTQAADGTLSQIETDLSTMDQATNSGENDVPSN
jgi:hypothetical protein